MAVIHLVRHGQASWGADDYDLLSDHGHAQSRRTGAALAAAGPAPARLVAGSMRRHAETSAAVLDGSGWTAPVEVDAGWDEFDHVDLLSRHGYPGEGPPDAAGLSRRQIDAWFDAAVARWRDGTHDADYAESFEAFTARVEAALRRTTESAGPGETVVVCTSGGPISWVAASLLGGGADLWWRFSTVAVNGGVTKVVVGERGASLVSFNAHAHLEPDHVTYR